MDRLQQVEKLCQAALELEENQRAAFLEKACSGDKELRREVESVLKFDKHEGGSADLCWVQVCGFESRGFQIIGLIAEHHPDGDLSSNPGAKQKFTAADSLTTRSLRYRLLTNTMSR